MMWKLALSAALLVARAAMPVHGAGCCGVTLEDAESCWKACPSGLDRDCPRGQSCLSRVAKQEVGAVRSAVLAEDDCVTAGCATLDACNGTNLDEDFGCQRPESFLCEHSWPGYNDCQSPPLEAMSCCWMASVDGSLALNEISIPGTHDTMAQGSSACLQAGVGSLIYTQAWSLRTMLDAGVRALDIRLRHVDDTFTLEHGVIELPFTFDADVRDVLAAFLSDNPSEAVIMFYQVNDLGPNTRSWEESLQESLDAVPGLWIGGSTIPTLDEARGSVVLANDMPRVEQNEYLVTWSSIGGKKSLIRDFFQAGEPEDNLFRVNYLSGTGVLLFPMAIARGIPYVYSGTNAIVLEFSGGCLGITMMDYVGEDAIAHIVAQQGRGAPTWTSP